MNKANKIASIFNYINENIKELTVPEIKQRIEPLMIGLRVESPIIPAGTFLYRARKTDTTFTKALGISLDNLKHKTENVALGRTNDFNQPVFYCSLSKEPIFYEIPNLRNGDEIILGFWQTSRDMFVNNIGYTQFMFDKMGAIRPCPSWTITKPDSNNIHQEIIINNDSLPAELKNNLLSQDENRAIRETMSKAFTCDVGESEKHKYKLTAALAALHLGTINNSEKFAGVLYPSVRIQGNGDNLALQPDFVNQYINFKKAVHLRIDNKIEDKKIAKFSITNLDTAIHYNNNGTLLWLGRILNWQLTPGQTATFKVQTGKDTYGDYEMSSNSIPCYWTALDNQTNAMIHPA